MAQIKCLTSDSWDFAEPVAALVRVSSRGLIGRDKYAFEKRASAAVLQDLDKVLERLQPGEELVHLLAVGTTEDYGPNRNGDGFKRRTCQDYHPTFEKYARFYRNHKNKDPKKSYGRVIKSAYHNTMHRIELLPALFATDAAARAGGGLVADKEMEKLASGQPLGVSMACHVGYDVCSYCGNHAPTAEAYCRGTDEGGMCKAGGLANRIGSLVEVDNNIHHLHADNPHPRFFDISHVYKPADRIAYVMGLIEKNASDRHVHYKSAELAKMAGVTLPAEFAIVGATPRVMRMLKLAYDLTSAEESLSPDIQRYGLAFRSSVQLGDTAVAYPRDAREKTATVLGALTKQRICLPLTRFIEIIGQQPYEKAASIAAIVAPLLPGVFSRLTDDAQLSERLAASQYTPRITDTTDYDVWATKLASAFSLSSQHTQTRLFRSSFREEPAAELRTCVKTAASTDPANRVAEEYAMYQLAFLSALPTDDPELPLTAGLLLAHNYAK